MNGLRKCVWILLALPFAACSDVTSPADASARNVSGGWSYAAASSDGTTVLKGTLEITQQGSTIAGVLDAQEQDSYGTRPIRGIMGGRVVADSSVEFDVVLAAGRTRRHVGSFAGDSVRGAWIETSEARVLGTGTFRGKRNVP